MKDRVILHVYIRNRGTGKSYYERAEVVADQFPQFADLLLSHQFDILRWKAGNMDVEITYAYIEEE